LKRYQPVYTVSGAISRADTAQTSAVYTPRDSIYFLWNQGAVVQKEMIGFDYRPSFQLR